MSYPRSTPTHPFFQHQGHAPFLVSLGFVCVVCVNFTVRIVKSIRSDIQLYQSLTLPTVELCLCVCVVKKLCAPLNIKSMTKRESTYIDVQHRHLSYKKTTTNGPMCVHLFRPLK